MMSRQKDFLEEESMLTKLVKKRGHLALFLPKFHCELNWAELFWSKSKSFVRQQVDGTWKAMVQAIWLSFGCRNIPIDLSHRFFRKCREIMGLYKHNLSGAFATYCQKSFNGHRQSFWCAEALEPWKVGSLCTCPPKPGTKRRLNGVIIQMEGQGEEQTASVQFPMGVVRCGVPVSVLKKRASNSVTARPIA